MCPLSKAWGIEVVVVAKGRQADLRISACLPSFFDLVEESASEIRSDGQFKDKKSGHKMKRITGGCIVKAMNRAALVVSVCVFLFPLAARADIQGKTFEANIFGGYNFFENSKNLADAPIFGGRISYNINRRYALELGVDLIQSHVADRALTGSMEGQFRSPMDKVNLQLYYVDALYHFTPESDLCPFVVLGIGGAHYSASIANSDIGVVVFGIGAKYRIVDQFGFRIDVRDNLVTEFFQESYSNIGITAGFTFTFGGPAQSASSRAATTTPFREARGASTAPTVTPAQN